MTTRTKHPKGMVAVTIDGTTYTMNKHGVVFAPSTPDPHFEGWEETNFADMDTTRKVRELARLAYLRHDGGPVYHLPRARQAFDSL